MRRLRHVSLPLSERALALAAWAGLVGVIVFLALFAFWAAQRVNPMAAQAANSTFLSDAYGEARSAVAAEDFWATEYLLLLGPESKHVEPAAVRKRHREAGNLLRSALTRVERIGTDEDRELAQAVRAQHSIYLGAAEQLFDAIDKRNAPRALRIEVRQIDPHFSKIERKVQLGAEQYRTAALARLTQMRKSDRLVYVGTIITFVVGLTLLTCFAVLLRLLTRRADEATHARLVALEKAALTDSLTGVRNHRAFHEDVARELAHARRSGLPLSVAMVDLEGLKQVNDSVGHQKGDEQLKALARMLRESARGSDGIYRVGGDEFAVLMSGERAWGAFQFVQRLQARLLLHPTDHGLAVAAGIAEASRNASGEEVLRRADLALIESKRSRRGAIIYTGDLQPRPVDSESSLRELHRKTLATALAGVVDSKDSYTRSHCETVAETCALIAQELGLESAHIGKIRRAGLLHDVGKIGIADAILQKPTQLTEDEFLLMTTHPRLGYDIISAAGLEEEAEWVLRHHERPDGRGYPDGLRGDAVPLESRIILVADAFEALTSDRPYRAAQSEEAAIDELYAHAGTQFDPDCVVALVRALSSTKPRVEQMPMRAVESA